MLRISIVIATYNRGENLIRTLRSLLRQRLDASQWEAVVVNNNSTDGTRGLFEAFAARHPQYNLRLVDETRQGLSYARNRGIAESRAPYIAIIDDDEEVNEGFAGSYAELFDRYGDAAAAGGKITPLYEYEPPKWLSPYTERPIAGQLDLGERIVPFRGESYPGGGNMAIRRSTIERYGAFDPELGRTGTRLLGGEEKDLFRRLKAAGETIYYVPGAEILHIIPRSRMTREYFTRLVRMTGVSERVRTLNVSRGAYIRRLGAELVKWGGTLALGAVYLLKGQPARAGYLVLMRRQITLGLLRGKERKPS